MRQFIVKIMILSALFGTFIIIMEFGIRNVPNDYSYKKALVENRLKEIEILVLGNSHTFHGLNPEHFKKTTFNLSFVSQTIKYDHFLLDHYIHRMPRLRYVVIPISYYTLFCDLEDGLETWRAKRYRHSFGYKRNNRSLTIDELWDESIVLSEDRIKTLRHLVRYYVYGKNAILSSETGWTKLYIDGITQDLEKLGERVAKSHGSCPTHHYESNKKYIQQIVSLTKKHKITTLFFIPPALEQYTKHLNKQQLTKTRKTLKNLVSKNTHAFFLDLLRNHQLEDTHFWDADHVNHSGAKLLSMRIQQELELIDQTRN